jgi:putative metal-binding protein
MGGAGGIAATTGAGGSTATGGGMGGAGGTMGTAATVCTPGEEMVCYNGPPGTAGVGLCVAGKKTCDALGAGFGPCVGEVLPEPETCLDADDNDCNGETNEDGEGCACSPNTTASCYDGPAGTLGIGVCKGGTHTCDPLGTNFGPCVGEVTPLPETCATAFDDDCNGQTNESGAGCACVPNSTTSCYSGPAGTLGVGLCVAGTQTCNAQGTGYGACVGEVVPQAETCNNAVDDDCNGQTNEGGVGCACAPNTTASCYTGPAGTMGVGLCAAGTKTCNALGTAHGACVGDVLPQTESCATLGDENCNGQANEGCACAPNAVASCYSGPAGTAGVGLCMAGTKTCNAQGTAYGACTGEVLPQTESCATTGDENCNGQVNEGCPCAPNSTSSCYSGPAGTQGVGACHGGTQTCNAQGTAYGPCVGEITPQPETCNTPIDDDCNGQTNEGGVGCACAPNSTSSCYSGPAGTQGVGICAAGTKTCNAQGTAYGACVGEILPQAETCSNSVDDNCNGQTNEGGVGCACAPNTATTCYSGPAGTAGVGICATGMKTCNALGTAYGACVGEITPQPETCSTPVDDDCNGQTNEGGSGCACAPNTVTNCYSGPAGTAGVGACTAGTKTCNAQGTAYSACSGEITPQAETCATSVDDDCNGLTNEGGAGCVCTPSSSTGCYSGPAGTLGVGICIGGTKTCNAQGTGYGTCVGEVTPQAETCSNSVDDDCNGQTNEGGVGCACAPNSVTSCYSGPAGTQGVGLCVAGTKTCNAQGTAYGACAGEILPLAESCGTVADDNCDGQSNEGCACIPNSTASCYSGPAGTQGVGLCAAGTKTCNAAGTSFGPCVGEVLPQTESCATTSDENCNGQVNEGCACAPNSTASCYSGPAGTQGVGVCHGGTQTCNAGGTAYGPCVGEITPQAETCSNSVDDDCNGQTNEGGSGCACAPNSTSSCYSGPAGTQGVGICAAGTKTCNALGTAYGACVGEVLPQAETCSNSVDDNCNGQTNEGGVGCACAPNTATTCYSGPAGTAGVGICATGMKTCNALGTAYGACVGEITPQAETCSTPVDDDCNGQTNEGGSGCACAPNTVTSCYSGPAGTQGVGLCAAGSKTCNAQGTAYGACVGEVLPQAETCNTAGDDDCNGQTNEGGAGCVCAPSSSAGCYSGPAGTLGVGICIGGTKTCNAQGTAYGSCVGEVTPQAETCSNSVDDDCNGQTNEGGSGCVCAPSSTASCYSGPAGTQGVGICAAGTKTCNAQGTAYGACSGEVLPQTETCLMSGDENCNGQSNEGCICVPSSTASCYSGPAGTQGVGICAAGTKTCNAAGTAYGACAGEVVPQAETCLSVGDENCNGQSDEGCICAPNSTSSCYSGPAGTQGVGICAAGTKTCNAAGTAYGACAGEVLPQTETCTNSVDDNCNGVVNESGTGCVCSPNSTAGCYSGPAGTAGVGICAAGTKTCNALGTAYGACAGEVVPQTETCTNSVDDNCNGVVNESGTGCVCSPNSTASCYSGPAGTQGVGACHGGTKTCNALGTAYGACASEVVPQAETCTTSVDDDCNGQTNEGGAGCVCAPNSTGSCYSGPAGTAGVGICKSGTHTCNGQGTAYGACSGEVLPQTETCTTTVDDNCNGVTNESGTGCVCTPNATTSCYSGPAGTAGVGICKAGTQLCNAQGTAIGACAGAVLPQGENCATATDDDCDGLAPPCSGTHLFSKAWGGGLDDEGNALAIDSANNILYAGYANGPVDFGCGPQPVAAGVDAALLMKLTPAGACTWAKSLGSKSQTTGVAVDAAGNVFATGTFGVSIDLGNGVTVNSVGGNDGFIVKYDPAGNYLWGRTFGDAAAQTTDGVATDASGNVFAYGYFNGIIDLGGGALDSAAGSDLYLAKYSPTGVHLWSKHFGDTSNQISKGIAVDPSGNVLFTGTMNGSVSFGGANLVSAGNGDAFIVKLGGATGSFMWNKRFGDSTSQAGSGVAVDPSGNVFLTGLFLGTMNFGGMNLTTAGGVDCYIAKFSSAGAHTWSQRFGGLSNQSFVAVATDPFGNVSTVGVLTSSSTFGGPLLTSAGNTDIVVAKYSASGAYLWSKSFGDANVQGVKGIAVDSLGDTFFTGLLLGPTDFGGGPPGVIGGGGEDTFITKLGP